MTQSLTPHTIDVVVGLTRKWERGEHGDMVMIHDRRTRARKIWADQGSAQSVRAADEHLKLFFFLCCGWLERFTGGRAGLRDSNTNEDPCCGRNLEELGENQRLGWGKMVRESVGRREGGLWTVDRF